MTEMGGISRFFVNRLTGRRNRRVAEWFVPNLHLPPSSAVLEIGCGNGDLAGWIVEALRPARYVATDLDPRQIEVARQHLASVHRGGMPTGLELRTADMLALPFPDASFDAVLASYSLHHADEHHRAFVNVPRALAEVDRVLRPGGFLAYVEIVNKPKVRAWLADHGYGLWIVANRWTSEAVVIRKPGGTGPRVPVGKGSVATS